MSGDNLGLKILEATSSGASVVSSYTRARATRGQALYDAAMLDLQAADARNIGNTEAARYEGQTDRKVGRVRTEIAGRGFAGGATADAQIDATDFVGRLDALTLRENARRKVAGLQGAAAGKRMEAGSISPSGEAIGTLVGQAGLLSRRWNKE